MSRTEEARRESMRRYMADCAVAIVNRVVDSSFETAGVRVEHSPDCPTRILGRVGILEEDPRVVGWGDAMRVCAGAQFGYVIPGCPACELAVHRARLVHEVLQELVEAFGAGWDAAHRAAEIAASAGRNPVAAIEEAAEEGNCQEDGSDDG